MISRKLGHSLDKYLDPIARLIPLSPNVLTIMGFAMTAIAGCALAISPPAGGVIMLFAGLFDMLDGAVARVKGKASDFGAFLDSVLDRYSDAFLFLGTAWHLRGTPTGAFLSLGSLVGAFMVSYTRARAEGLGKECKAGLLERPERILLLSFGALTGLLVPVLWVMFALTHLTAVQRIYHARKAMRP